MAYAMNEVYVKRNKEKIIQELSSTERMGIVLIMKYKSTHRQEAFERMNLNYEDIRQTLKDKYILGKRGETVEVTKILYEFMNTKGI